MGKLCHLLYYLCLLTATTKLKDDICHAKDLEEQKRLWNAFWLVRIFKSSGGFLVDMFIWVLSLIFLNKFVLWYGGGVPAKQFELIQKDQVPIGKYIARTFNGVAENSHLRTHNYFYYNCLMGRFTHENCPSYLKPDNFKMLKAGGISRLEVVTGTFLDCLRSRKYSKVILMDHVDWLDDKDAIEVARTLRQQVLPGGKVIWRSASYSPPYAEFIKSEGFDVKRLQVATDGYMDRVNMYSSFYVAVRKA